MLITVKIKDNECELDVPDASDYEQLLLTLDINPEEALVFVDGRAVPLDESVESGPVYILKIVSGG